MDGSTTAMTLTSLITSVTSVMTAFLGWLTTLIGFVSNNPILLIFVIMSIAMMVLRACKRWIPGL